MEIKNDAIKIPNFAEGTTDVEALMELWKLQMLRRIECEKSKKICQAILDNQKVLLAQLKAGKSQTAEIGALLIRSNRNLIRQLEKQSRLIGVIAKNSNILQRIILLLLQIFQSGETQKVDPSQILSRMLDKKNIGTVNVKGSAQFNEENK
jgi:hypothetical protein